MEEGRVTVDGDRAPGRPAVHGDRHPEPHRAGRHLPAARGAARPVPDEDQPRLPRPRVDRRAARGRGDARPRRRRAARHHRERRRRDGRSSPTRCTSTRPSSATSASSPHESRQLAPRRARASASAAASPTSAPPRRGPLADGRNYVVPDDIKELAVPGPRPPAPARRRSGVLRHHRRGCHRPAAQPGPAADRARGVAMASSRRSPFGPRSRRACGPRPAAALTVAPRTARCARSGRACAAITPVGRAAMAVGAGGLAARACGSAGRSCSSSPPAVPSRCSSRSASSSAAIAWTSASSSTRPGSVSATPAAGRLVATNRSRARLRPLSVELPVGRGRATFQLPSLAAGPATTSCSSCRPNAAPSSRSARPSAVRTDPLGLLRRDAVEQTAVELFVHPRIIAPGLAQPGPAARPRGPGHARPVHQRPRLPRPARLRPGRRPPSRALAEHRQGGPAAGPPVPGHPPQSS